MSCITIVGRERRWNADCDVPLPRTAPYWSPSKRKRLQDMAFSQTVTLRVVAANHPRTEKWVLTELLFDDDVTVRRAAVKNPTLTDTQLRIALMDHDLGISAYARLLLEENTDGQR